LLSIREIQPQQDVLFLWVLLPSILLLSFYFVRIFFFFFYFSSVPVSFPEVVFETKARGKSEGPVGRQVGGLFAS
jgi:hypothetical protein